MNIFMPTLNQMAFLFALIIAGFLLRRRSALPENTSAVLAKLENTLFIPALVLGTFAQNFTIERIASAGRLFAFSFVLFAVVCPLAIWASRLCSRDGYVRNIFTYGLAFSNFGFMGNAVVSALFPEIFMDYLIFTLPLWIMIYLWGVPVLLIPSTAGKPSFKERMKSFLNPMFIAMIIGMVLGLLNFRLPAWLSSVVTVMGDCMSPIAMLLTGVTVAAIDLKKTFRSVPIYAVSLIRLLAFPLVFIPILMLLRLPQTTFICAVCSLAMPLGLNTVVIPSAYGRDTSVAAGMAIISHLLSCATIPLVFAIVMRFV